MACRRASWPTKRSPWSVNATTDGVVRDPSALEITVGWPPSTAAITEFVVPRSIPTAFAITFLQLQLSSSAGRRSMLGGASRPVRRPRMAPGPPRVAPPGSCHLMVCRQLPGRVTGYSRYPRHRTATRRGCSCPCCQICAARPGLRLTSQRVARFEQRCARSLSRNCALGSVNSITRGRGPVSRRAAPSGEGHPKIFEMLVCEADGHRAFTRGRRHPLDRSASDVPGCEDARPAGLEHKRSAADRPRRALRGRDGGAGEDESVVVQCELISQPADVG